MVTTRARTVGMAAILTTAAVILFVFDPTRVGFLPPCPLHEFTGLWCPGCGSTRALHQLVHGHLALA